MEAGWLVFLITVGAVALFVGGMGLTLFIKGHHIDSEIGDNRHMKARGITCAAAQIRAEEAALRGETPTPGCEEPSCGSCAVGNCENNTTTAPKAN